MKNCLTALFLLSFTGLGWAQTQATSVDFETQTITMAMTQEPPQLNGMKATDQVNIMILSHVRPSIT